MSFEGPKSPREADGKKPPQTIAELEQTHERLAAELQARAEPGNLTPEQTDDLITVIKEVQEKNSQA